ncbi:MAG: pyruvate formate lyase-activating protein [Clostridia bacterium]|nr:pyruvate formate lyase-activating protein [Clostridia bacterium]
MLKGRIHSIETMAAVDGPGLRFAVFFQGCPQRCIYCHNPDTWNVLGGEEMTAEEIVKKAVRYKSYFGETGGVTVTGGEPFMQSEFLIELLKKCKEENIHTAVDTCGFYLDDKVKEALSYTDLVMLDIKHTNKESFEKITKQDISRPLAFLDYMKETQKPIWIRQVIVPTLTDSEEQILDLLKLIEGANVKKIELLPYHTLGSSKWEELGLTYELPDISPPTEEIMAKLREIVKNNFKH